MKKLFLKKMFVLETCLLMFVKMGLKLLFFYPWATPLASSMLLR